jgi:DNA-binding transcriptional regulator YiaG
MSMIKPDDLTPEMILRIRERLNLSQDLMARRLNTHQKSISHWETGKFKPSRFYRSVLTHMANEVLTDMDDRG